MLTLTLDAARAFVADTLVRCGTREDAAASTARALVGAEADGLKGHGLSRLPAYAAQVRAGKIRGAADVAVAQPRPALLAVDAGYGFAYPALDAAVAALPPVARAQGLAAAAIRRSHHCGAAGRPVEALAAQGLVAILFANTPAAMAPWGGSRPVFGTNPVAFACPLPDAAPVVVDLSLSKVARGNILTAGLTGARFAGEASSFLDAAGDPPGTGQLILAFDAAAFAADAVERFGVLAAAIAGQEGARLPGSRRLQLRARAETHGIAIADALKAESDAA